MPIYEYHCGTCNKNLEIIQKMSDPPQKKCPDCGGKIEKLLSSSAFHLKGTGWYKTDYASPSGSTSSSPSSGTEAKTEAPKPAAKAE